MVLLLPRPQNVQLKIFGGGSIQATVFKTSMQVCTDGGDSHGNPTPPHQDRTTYQYKGTYLNADNIPYIVLPMNNKNDVALGDVGIVINQNTGASAYVIYGERGQEDRIGEASVKTNLDLGNDIFTSRGLNGDDDLKFIYIMFNGSGKNTSFYPIVFKDGTTLPTNSQIQAKAAAYLSAFTKQNDYI